MVSNPNKGNGDTLGLVSILESGPAIMISGAMYLGDLVWRK